VVHDTHGIGRIRPARSANLFLALITQQSMTTIWGQLCNVLFVLVCFLAT
jgi:hypothetical protein